MTDEPSEFDRDTSVSPGDGGFTADLGEGWMVGNGINGGYLLATIGRALGAIEPGWLRLRHATRNVAGGMFEEDCEVWDSAGRLVAQSRQLARFPRPA